MPGDPNQFKSAKFENLPTVIMGSDGMCTCSCADVCPLGRTGMEYRCTYAELKWRDDQLSMLKKAENKE